MCANPEKSSVIDRIVAGDTRTVARAISRVEDGSEGAAQLMKDIFPHTGRGLVVGITGAPGAGKSTLVDKLALLKNRNAHLLIASFMPALAQ